MNTDEISLAEFPQLRKIAWRYEPDAIIPGVEALALYERNWRLVDADRLDRQEEALITDLIQRYADAKFKASERLVLPDSPKLHSIGHSNIGFEQFLESLIRHKITAIADVRSSPYSSSEYLRHFDRETMAQRLRRHGIAYVFLGAELGGRPEDPSLYKENGRADYTAMEKTPLFETGIERLMTGASRFEVAMMCTERDPLTCHRCLQVGRHLCDNGIDVRHIDVRDTAGDSQPRSHLDIEAELIAMLGKRRGQKDPVDPNDPETLEIAYARQADRIAYRRRGFDNEVTNAAAESAAEVPEDTEISP